MEKKELVLYSREAIAERVGELAKEIDAAYAGEEILIIGLLRGCFVFCSDLVREMKSKNGNRLYDHLQLRKQRILFRGGEGVRRLSQ